MCVCVCVCVCVCDCGKVFEYVYIWVQECTRDVYHCRSKNTAQAALKRSCFLSNKATTRTTVSYLTTKHRMIFKGHMAKSLSHTSAKKEKLKVLPL